MSKLSKTFFVLALLGLVFGLGYVLGSQQSFTVRKTLNRVRSEMTSQIEGLEQSLRHARMRLNLMNAKAHLLSAKVAIQEGRFPQAREELDKAEAELQKASETTERTRKEELAVLISAVRDVRRQVVRSNPRAASGVEEALRALERFLS